jgi:hypothetical protein
MKHLNQILLLLSLISGVAQTAGAAETSASYLPNPETCAVRLSNLTLRGSVTDQVFCTGTVINENTIVTAAHCLETVMSDQAFFVSFNDSTSEQEIPPLSRSGTEIFSPPLMSTQRQREKYLQTADSRLTNSDFVILQLAKPLKEAVGKKCPQLPTATECAQLKTLLDSSAAAPYLSAYFYRSTRVSVSGDRLFANQTYFPSSNLLAASANQIQALQRDQALDISFASRGQPLEARLGDSGTGLLFLDGLGGSTLVGVQSATTTLSGNVAMFAQICPWVQAIPQQSQRSER